MQLRSGDRMLHCHFAKHDCSIISHPYLTKPRFVPSRPRILFILSVTLRMLHHYQRRMSAVSAEELTRSRPRQLLRLLQGRRGAQLRLKGYKDML